MSRQSTERTRNLGLAVVVILVLAVIVAAVLWSTRGGDTPATADVKPVATVSGDALVIGPASAAHTVVVYEDFRSPSCRELENASRDFLAEAAARGKVRVEYRPITLPAADDYSARALRAFGVVLRDGTPAQALKLHDLLFDHQPEESAADGPDADQLRAWAKQAGAAAAVVERIGPVDESYVDSATGAARSAGVTSAPTVVLDGRTVDAGSVVAVADVLEKTIGG